MVPGLPVEEPALFRLRVHGLEVVDVEPDVVVPRRLGALAQEEVELLVAEREPADPLAERGRRNGLHAEQLLVEARRGLEVVGVDADVVEAHGPHRPGP